MTKLMTERNPVMGTIDPQNGPVGDLTSDWVPLSQIGQVLFALLVGAIGAGGTIDMKLQEATSSAGANAKDLTGKAITQLTKAGNDDNKQVLINIRADELSAGFSHVAAVVSVGVAASDVALVAIGGDPAYKPVDGIDLSTVDEIVA